MLSVPFPCTIQNGNAITKVSSTPELAILISHRLFLRSACLGRLRWQTRSLFMVRVIVTQISGICSTSYRPEGI